MASPSKETDHEQDVLHLFKAIAKGKAHLTRFMLAASGPTLLNCFNEQGRTPLMECCYIREEVTRVNMVKCIRDAGADVNVRDAQGRTALIHACMQRCNDVVRILIMHCRIVPDSEDCDGNTALIHSAHNGNDVAVELLVRNFRRLGLQVDHFNKEGYAALHVAARNGFLQCAKILATKGKATLTLKDKVSNMTPMEMCLAEGYQKSEVEFLKPSVKFYKVAKLTTTMVKYRKRSSSGQESIGSAASKIAPAATGEKDKKLMSKLNLLKKSKTLTNNEAGTSGNSMSNASAPVAPSQPQPPVQKSVGSKENAADQANSASKAKRMPLLKDMAKKSGQLKYSNCSEKKSEVIRLLGAGIKKDGTVANSHSPMMKRKTEGMIDIPKSQRPPKVTTSNSMTSPFTEKDFADEADDVTTCSMATDVTDVDADDQRISPSNAITGDDSLNNSSYNTPAAFKNNNNNNKNNNNSTTTTTTTTTTTRGLQNQHTNENDKHSEFSEITEEEGLESSQDLDYESSLSECTLPSMSPTTQTECTDESLSRTDEGESQFSSQNATTLSSSSTSQPACQTTRPSKLNSQNAGVASTSPQTEVEYISHDDDQTNPSHTGSASSNDITYTGSANSDDSSSATGAGDELRPNFDNLVTGHVLNIIDDRTTTKTTADDSCKLAGKDRCDPTRIPNSTTQNYKSTELSPNLGSENNRKNVNGLNLNKTPGDSERVPRTESASPETIIESLDNLSIPKDFDGCHKTGNDGSIEILRYTKECVDSKNTGVDLNESTT